jgi:hypothetical protein
MTERRSPAAVRMRARRVREGDRVQWSDLSNAEVNLAVRIAQAQSALARTRYQAGSGTHEDHVRAVADLRKATAEVRLRLRLAESLDMEA